jgi:hypothetical protein
MMDRGGLLGGETTGFLSIVALRGGWVLWWRGVRHPGFYVQEEFHGGDVPI